MFLLVTAMLEEAKKKRGFHLSLSPRAQVTVPAYFNDAQRQSTKDRTLAPTPLQDGTPTDVNIGL